MFDFVYNIDLWVALFFMLGFSLVIVEAFIPGFGAPGIVGAIFLVLGILVAAKNILDVIIMSAIILLILGIITLVSIFTIKRGRRSDTLVLTSSLDKESGYHGTEDLSAFAGKEGIALTALRPSGTMGIGNQKIDVVSEFGFIGIGTKIKIIDVKGRRIVVREVK